MAKKSKSKNETTEEKPKTQMQLASEYLGMIQECTMLKESGDEKWLRQMTITNSLGSDLMMEGTIDVKTKQSLQKAASALNNQEYEKAQFFCREFIEALGK